jgi:hypothetical protein
VDRAQTEQSSADHPTALTAAFLVPKVVSRLAELFLESAINRLVAIGDLVWNTARKQMLIGMQAGESIVEIRNRLMETTKLASPRAEVIARTEVIGASNAGSYAEMKATGLNATKEWIATEDTRTRPSHTHIDGEEIGIDDKFIVGGYAMSYPHDPTGPPQETISCRCTLGWDIPEEEFLTIDGAPLAAAATAFHLKGLHDQHSHGRRGARSVLGGSIAPGKTIKMTHGLVHKKHPGGTTIAVNKGGDKKVTWNGKSYDLDTKQSDGSWKTEKKVIKSKAYKEINDFDSAWHEPVAEGDDTELPSAKTAPTPTPSKPSAPATAPTPTTPKAVMIGKYDAAKPGKPIALTQELIDQNYPPHSVVAITPDGNTRLAWGKDKFQILEREPTTNTWFIVEDAPKNKALAMANGFSKEWHASVEDSATSTIPAAPATPTPTTTPAASGPKTFTPIQKAYAQSIFGSNGVKWHTDTKKIYDSALEVSQKDSSLTMADALAIMDQSLQKKTGDPFQTKMTKFLQTKAGMKYAQEKGGSAPVGSMVSTAPAAPSVKIPKSNALATNLSKPAATKMQDDMNKVAPPPWTAAQKAALRKYTGGDYKVINKCARGTGACTPATLKTLADIKAGMKPSTQNIKLYRKTALATFGVKSNAELEAFAGNTIRDDGVISTSITEGTWSGEVHVKIEAPAGSKMAWVAPISHYPGENEFVLAPGTEFEVISVEPHYSFPNQRVMKVRIVPGSGTP